ncbi:hypothetical protein G3O06_19085 [Burkholderia sp. Ac-20345]|uniref:hypothetical protein n=1 Tax=Burkholderia sp. Ac-20345 TaxID=2703891 RepID=UPI00197C5CA0|nr:hypothetical protein [Burkholderia sp. Ac-20345]MBN3779644.1 hypothetical protein [Burkholderia sp. Ac-20345]
MKIPLALMRTTLVHVNPSMNIGTGVRASTLQTITHTDDPHSGIDKLARLYLRLCAFHRERPQWSKCSAPEAGFASLRARKCGVAGRSSCTPLPEQGAALKLSPGYCFIRTSTHVPTRALRLERLRRSCLSNRVLTRHHRAIDMPPVLACT